ncbi:MAG: hypothetical protein R2707_16455 [Acidimicrobiales bacterium]
MRCVRERREKVISDWTWMVYDDHGPWDSKLGDTTPTHGWRRIVELQLGPVELVVTEWLFGRIRPAEISAGVCREVHAVRMPGGADADDGPRAA